MSSSGKCELCGKTFDTTYRSFTRHIRIACVLCIRTHYPRDIAGRNIRGPIPGDNWIKR
jgi:hypothetical protein